MNGARYAISIDGAVRTNRDVWEIAVEAAEMLKNGGCPHSMIEGTPTLVECGCRGSAAPASTISQMIRSV